MGQLIHTGFDIPNLPTVEAAFCMDQFSHVCPAFENPVRQHPRTRTNLGHVWGSSTGMAPVAQTLRSLPQVIVLAPKHFPFILIPCTKGEPKTDIIACVGTPT